MDLQTLILRGGHQWDGNPPATEADLAALVAASPVPLPTEYLVLLRLSDGGEAILAGCPRYVRIWSARAAVATNANYDVSLWLPGFVGFGDTGDLDMAGFDTRQGQPYPVCAVPFAPMEWADAMGAVPPLPLLARPPRLGIGKNSIE